jgi:hypothetical protein
MANAPVFLNTTVRPVKVVVAEPSPSVSIAKNAALYVPIWKCGTSTVDEVVLAALYKCAAPPQRRCLGPHAHYYDGRHQQSEAQKAASTIFLPSATSGAPSSVATFYMGPSTASSDYNRVRRLPGSSLFTIVRDPLTRFVSGWLPRSTMPLCEDGPRGVRVATWLGASKAQDTRRQNVSGLVESGALFACPDVVRTMEAHAHNITVNPEAFPFHRIGWIHWLSQTYFLAATDADGTSLHFDHVIRLEQFDDDLRGVLRSLGVQDSLPSNVERRRHNANHMGTVGIYAAALRRKPQTMCVICGILASDYECLGYEPPPECGQCAQALKVSQRPEEKRRQTRRDRIQQQTQLPDQHPATRLAFPEVYQTRCTKGPDSCEFLT